MVVLAGEILGVDQERAVKVLLRTNSLGRSVFIFPGENNSFHSCPEHPLSRLNHPGGADAALTGGGSGHICKHFFTPP